MYQWHYFDKQSTILFKTLLWGKKITNITGKLDAESSNY